MILRDFDDDDLDEPEWGEGDDNDDDTAPCPHCGALVYDDSERCDRCGLYVSREDDPSRKPLWVVAGVAACLAMVTWWILHP